jgi:GTPase SAR1 family protein
VIDLAWSKKTGLLGSLSEEGDIRLWNVELRELLSVYRCGEQAFDIEFSPDGKILIVRTLDKLLFVEIQQLGEIVRNGMGSKEVRDEEGRAEIFSLDCHAVDSGCMSVDYASGQIAAEDELEHSLKIWDLDFEFLVKCAQVKKRRYRIAKVVVIGDHRAGKTNLASALTGATFRPESFEHGLQVHRLRRSEYVDDTDGADEVREILVWDRPSKSDCDILESVDAAHASAILEVFDWQSSQSAIQEFAQLRRTIRTSESPEGLDAGSNSVLVVGAKADRARDSANLEIRSMLCRRFQVPRIFSRSAKDGTGVDELREAICDCIDWQKSAAFEPAETFQDIHDFVLERKEDGRKTGLLLESTHSLSSRFPKPHQVKLGASLPDMFKAGIHLLKILGEIYHFSSTDQILLDPKYFYTYASALAAFSHKGQAE